MVQRKITEFFEVEFGINKTNSLIDKLIKDLNLTNISNKFLLGDKVPLNKKRENQKMKKILGGCKIKLKHCCYSEKPNNSVDKPKVNNSNINSKNYRERLKISNPELLKERTRNNVKKWREKNREKYLKAQKDYCLKKKIENKELFLEKQRIRAKKYRENRRSVQSL